MGSQGGPSSKVPRARRDLMRARQERLATAICSHQNLPTPLQSSHFLIFVLFSQKDSTNYHGMLGKSYAMQDVPRKQLMSKLNAFCVLLCPVLVELQIYLAYTWSREHLFIIRL